MENREENPLKTRPVGSNVENLGKLSVAEVKNDHRLASIFLAKPLPYESYASEPQTGDEAEEDE